MRIQKHSRWTAMLLAAVVAILTSMVVANATQTITTPNAVNISYSLAPGASSSAITPVVIKPVLVMGCTTNFDQSVSQVSLVRLPNFFIGWVGLESAGSGITHGVTNTAGTHIVYIDSVHLVDIQVASADTIKIHNADPTITKAGNVTLIW